MPSLLRQSLNVLIVGLALGAANGVLRGFPTPPVEAATCQGPVPAQPLISWVTQEQALGLQQQGALFLDARPEDAYETGHVAGAVHAPMDTGVPPDGIVEQAQAASIVVTYCDTQGECAASTRLAELLGTSGVRDVRVLEGGMPAWLEHGYPAEAGACPNDCP